MRKHVKELWLEALRSGKYEQTKNLLCDSNNRYCCLGVLTELYIAQMKKNRKKAKITKCPALVGGWKKYTTDTNEYTCTIPLVVKKWAGLTTGQVSWAMHMNDNCNLDFRTIANAIDCTY